MFDDTNVQFDGRDYIVMPTDAVKNLSPLAYDVLGRIVTTLYMHPNSSFSISNIIKQYPTQSRYQVEGSIKELREHKYLLYKNKKWILNQEV